MPAAFRTSAPMVLVPATVTDHNGKTIEGLRAENFKILQDQTRQQIVSFRTEDAPSSDEFLLLTVSTQPVTISRFTTDIADLEDGVERTSPGGMTALIDTVYLGLNGMRKAPRPRRALLVLSDGMDNYSRSSKGERMRVALEADVQIYTILVDGIGGTSVGIPFRPSMIAKPIDQARERQGPLLLEELSNRTGGLHFHVRNGAEAKEAAIKIGRALRNEYVIGYQPPVSGTTGKYHRVHVKSKVPKVNVYARNGYYAPYATSTIDRRHRFTSICNPSQ